MSAKNTSLITFDFNETAIRVIDRDGNPWFVAADVCKVLDIENARDAVSTLDEDEKITVGNPDGNPRAGIPHSYNIISESGLYSLVFRSRKPEAKAFSRWVRKEVLPSIRKTGKYVLKGSIADCPFEPLIEAGESAAIRLAEIVRHPETPQADVIVSAGTIASLLKECRALHSMRLRSRPMPEIYGHPGDELGEVLAFFAGKLAGDSAVKMGELIGAARECGKFTGEDDSAGRKSFGIRLQRWLGFELSDGGGRSFEVRKSRSKHGVVYHFTFR